MAEIVNALKVRQNLGEFLERVYYKGAKFIIKRAGKSMAAIIPLEDYKDLERRKLDWEELCQWGRAFAKRKKITEKDIMDAIYEERYGKP